MTERKPREFYLRYDKFGQFLTCHKMKPSGKYKKNIGDPSLTIHVREVMPDEHAICPCCGEEFDVDSYKRCGRSIAEERVIYQAIAKELAEALDECSTHLPGVSKDCHRVRDLCDEALAKYREALK